MKLKILDFPELRQLFDYDCGASALQSVLTYYGYKRREDLLFKKLGAKSTDVFNNGVKIKDIVKVARGYSLTVRVERGLKAVDLKKYIDLKIPVICLVQAWRESGNIKLWKNDYKDGHYVVAIGYDDKRIIFEDPASYTRTWLTYEELDLRWHAIDDKNKPDPVSVAIIIKGEIKYKSNELTHMG
jgi:predicted double-glycine peptidase